MITEYVTETGVMRTLTVTIEPDVSGFIDAMDRVQAASREVSRRIHAMLAEMYEGPARRSAMHAAYRAKTRRRNRR